jgi:hypothetical protein
MSGALQAVFQNQRSFIAAPGQNQYCSPGTYSWIAPTGITKVSIVTIGRGGCGGNGYRGPCLGGGGGGGGGLAYKNCVTVSPGTSYPFVVGNTTTALGLTANKGGNGAAGPNGSKGVGGTASGGSVNYTGGDGKDSAAAFPPCAYWGGAGGGSAGYTGAGLVGTGNTTGGNSGDGNLGGTSGGRGAGGGGGTSLIGSGTAVPKPEDRNQQGGPGACFGGGGGGGPGGNDYIPFGGSVIGGPAGSAGIRVLWGPGRAYPNTCTGNK